MPPCGTPSHWIRRRDFHLLAPGAEGPGVTKATLSYRDFVMLGSSEIRRLIQRTTVPEETSLQLPLPPLSYPLSLSLSLSLHDYDIGITIGMLELLS
jgi:hypothetical protein